MLKRGDRLRLRNCIPGYANKITDIAHMFQVDVAEVSSVRLRDVPRYLEIGRQHYIKSLLSLVWQPQPLPRHSELATEIRPFFTRLYLVSKVSSVRLRDVPRYLDIGRQHQVNIESGVAASTIAS